MEVMDDLERFRAACEQVRRSGAEIGFVPTMGDLHQGHARLVKSAREGAQFVALSIFVNPLQFTSEADLGAYPRVLERDRAVAQKLGVDVVFAPTEPAMFPGGPPEVWVDPGPLGELLEGRSRPGHFRGVLTVVALAIYAVTSDVSLGSSAADLTGSGRRLFNELMVLQFLGSAPGGGQLQFEAGATPVLR